MENAQSNEKVSPEHSVSTGTSELVAKDQPTENWTLDQLANYVKAGLKESRVAETTAKALTERLAFVRRTSVLAYFRAGLALALAKDKLKQEGDWCDWQKTHRLSRKTVWVAIMIYEGAGTEDEVSKYTLAQAKRKWCSKVPKELTNVEQPPATTEAATNINRHMVASQDETVPQVTAVTDTIAETLHKESSAFRVGFAANTNHIDAILGDVVTTLTEIKSRIHLVRDKQVTTRTLVAIMELAVELRGMVAYGTTDVSFGNTNQT